jgi:hypothetical protein
MTGSDETMWPRRPDKEGVGWHKATSSARNPPGIIQYAWCALPGREALTNWVAKK